MTDDIKNKEKQLEGLKVDHEIENEKEAIAQKKKLIAEAKQTYGRDWKKVIGGALKGVHINQDALTTMYSSGFGLKEKSQINVKRFK